MTASTLDSLEVRGGSSSVEIQGPDIGEWNASLLRLVVRLYLGPAEQLAKEFKQKVTVSNGAVSIDLAAEVGAIPQRTLILKREGSEHWSTGRDVMLVRGPRVTLVNGRPGLEFLFE